MKPYVKLTVDGTPVAGLFYERLISIRVTDKDGDSADTIDIDLNDGPPNYLAIPRKGAIIALEMGYEDNGLPMVGRFTVDKVTFKCLPYSMSISGKSADLRAGKLKERQERHFDGKSLGDILGTIAGESGLTPSVDPDLGNIRYTWIGQQDESNIHFARRLAERHNALFSIKGGRLVFAKKGSGNSAGGTFLGSVVITPARIIKGSCSFEANDRTRYSKVVAYYQDGEKAERREIEANADAGGDSVYRIPEPYSSVSEADEAAQAKAKDLKRGEGACSVTVVGDPAVCAGAPLLFEGVRPGLDGVPYVIDQVVHEYRKQSGMLSQISAKLYDGKSASSGSASDDADTSTGSAGSASDGEVAPNSPDGTPATPTLWTAGRRYGSTDAN